MGIVTPVELRGKVAVVPTVLYSLTIETVAGCLIMVVVAEGFNRHVVGVVDDDDDDDDEPVIGVLVNWNVGGTAAATGPPPPPTDAVVAATLVVVNILFLSFYVLIFLLFIYLYFVVFQWDEEEANRTDSFLVLSDKDRIKW